MYTVERREVSILILPIIFLFGISGCKKKPPEEVVEKPGAMVITEEMSVLSIEPERGSPQKETPVTIYGVGFHDGATASIGETPIENTIFLNENTLKGTVPSGLSVGYYDVVVTNPDGKTARLAGGFKVQEEVMAECEIERVHFEFDRSDITEEAARILNRDYDCLKKRGIEKIKIEGHCDERGTTEYNMALGERRAKSVKNYLKNLGFHAKNIETVSYGEERPLVNRSDEEAWAQNRRAEIVIIK